MPGDEVCDEEGEADLERNQAREAAECERDDLPGCPFAMRADRARRGECGWRGPECCTGRLDYGAGRSPRCGDRAVGACDPGGVELLQLQMCCHDDLLRIRVDRSDRVCEQECAAAIA